MLDDSYCNRYNESGLRTLSEAKGRCDEDPSCFMVYQTPKPNDFRLCVEGAEIQASSYGARLYMKKGN